jgi:hypothetical protein
MAYTNFNTIQGDTFSLTIEYTDANGLPIDISDFEIIAEVRDKPGGKTICGKISTQDGGIVSISDNIGATIIVTFPPSITEKFILPKCYYQVKIIDTGDTLLNGWIELEATNI